MELAGDERILAGDLSEFSGRRGGINSGERG